MQRIALAVLSTILLVAADGGAQTPGNRDEVLVENQWTKLTRGDYELELQRVPEEMRTEFAMSPKRVTTTLNQVLVDKSLARQARDEGMDRDPEIAARLAHEIDRFYAEAEILKIERAAGAEFDAHASDYLPKVRETYSLDKDKYRLPDQVSASHILFSTTKHGDAEALALANEARAKLAAGADFSALARQVSDDPTAAANGGALGWFAAARMDPTFSKAAFALQNVGDLSPPVLTKFGYHVIRLDGKRGGEQRSFEQASKQIMAQLRDDYVKAAHQARIAAIVNDPHIKINQAAVDALVVKQPEAPKVSPQASGG